MDDLHLEESKGPSWVEGRRSWTRWNNRYWPRRSGWSPSMAGLIARTTTAPERWPYPQAHRANAEVPQLPGEWVAPTWAARSGHGLPVPPGRGRRTS